jgi:endonuclease YncB( thermonuclease family)
MIGAMTERDPSAPIAAARMRAGFTAMRVRAGFVAIAAALLAAAPASGKELGTIVGKAFVVDANIVEVKGQRIRLFAVDAPDRRQTCATGKGGAYPCGLRAAFALDNLAKGKVISCVPRGVDSDLRILAVCSYAGLDIGGAMVESGWSIADVRYSDQYVETEDAAHAAKLGLWAGAFDDPTEWRQKNKNAKP